MSLLYKPTHPMADKQGFVDKQEYYMYEFMTKPDNRMMVGNKPVQIFYNSDQMDETRHMANGKYYTSKAKFRQATKAAGCIEVGNETATVTKSKKYIAPDKRMRREDIKKAIYQLRNK